MVTMAEFQDPCGQIRLQSTEVVRKVGERVLGHVILSSGPDLAVVTADNVGPKYALGKG
jgi:hypothetical protein